MAAAHGLSGAPLTKLWLYVVALGTVLVSSMNWRHYARLRIVPYVVRDWQFWRGATSLISFSTYTELAVGMIMIYQLRAVERLFGTRKYAAFLFIAGLVGQVLCIVGVWALLMTRRTLAAAIVANLSVSAAMGPFALIFAVLYQYYLHIPSQRRSAAEFMGVLASDKWIVYFVAVSLWPSSKLGAIVPSAAGVAASYVYSANIAGLRYWRFPLWASGAAQRLLLPLLSSHAASGGASQSSTARLADTAAARNAAFLRGFQHFDQTRQQHTEPPDEELVAQLQSMFPDAGRERVAQALQASRNDPNRAAAIMLEH
ncbi:hypothetical protein IW140_004413 [Coemansia sp. RSA 1813]|nr:hypothetical protein EV178_004466 [Coemansia sp. RSA 1646]KAJ1767208.1 hypothetical protein LPJ74_005504 [Coemansia sp. RSA 1843]KAJ2567623.1 hypothetical protein IW140_004413 [Coemansia sp. RSA 1813]